MFRLVSTPETIEEETATKNFAGNKDVDSNNKCNYQY